jgi:YD repeat-containing protein
MSVGLVSVSYGYNQLLQMTSETRTFTGLSGSYALTYAYNLVGELTSLIEPSQFGASVSYGYDGAGRMTSVNGAGMQTSSLMTSMQYRASGALKHASYGDGTQLNLSYNSRQLLTRFELSNVLDVTTYPQVVTTMGTQNDYDADGRIHYAADLRNGNFDRGYTYDDIGRLKEATSGREARGLLPNNPVDSPYKQTFSYDTWNNMGRTGRLWSQGVGDAPTYTNNRRSDWYYDAEGNALLTNPNKTHDYDAAGKQVHTYEESWTDPTGNWVFHQDSIDQVYSGDGLPGKRIETRHTENSQSQITNDVKTVYFLTSTVLGGVSVDDIYPDERVGYVYVGGQKLGEYGGTAPYVSISFRHENPVTGNWVTVNNGNGRRTEFDPLGATVGTIDQGPSTYADMVGTDLLYRELGNPFDPGNGCRLDGMPAKCQDLDNRMQNGLVASEELGGRRRQGQIMGLPGGLFRIWIPDPDHHTPFPEPINSDVVVTNHEADDQAGHFDYFSIPTRRARERNTNPQNTGFQKPREGDKAKFNAERFRHCLDVMYHVQPGPEDGHDEFFATTRTEGHFIGVTEKGQIFGVNTSMTAYSSSELRSLSGNTERGMILGGTIKGHPYLNFVASNVASNPKTSLDVIMMIQIHELGNSLAQITGYAPDAHNDELRRYDADSGQALVECAYGGFVRPDGRITFYPGG